MDNFMKVLIISSIFPYPKDNGKKIILSSIVEYFLEKYGEESVTYIVVGSFVEEQKNFLTISLRKPNLSEQLYNLINYTLIKRMKSIQESMLFSQNIKEKLYDYLKKGKYDLVIYDTVRIAQYFEKDLGITIREVLYLDDLFSIRYEKMLEAIQRYPNVKFNSLGNFTKFLPSFARSITDVKCFNKMLLNFEKELIYNREIDMARRFRNCLLISEEEANILKQRSNQEGIYSIKPVLKTKNIKRNYDGNGRFIFLGSLNIPHNDVSIRNFIEQNIDFIMNTPNVFIDIIGKNPTKELINLAQEYPKIRLHGYIENLEEIFANSCAMLVPLLFGSGVKLKTLEAFSMGLPVISTDFGIEGINLKTGKECIVENDIKKYQEHMLRLMDKSYNEQISKNSKLFFETHYSKDSIYKEYDILFSR